MSINWDVVFELAKLKAKRYADDRCFENSAEHVKVFNAYHDGYIENAAEKESLRAILERKDKEAKVQPTPTDNSLDDLI